MQSHLALKSSSKGAFEISVIANDYSVDEDGMTKIDEEVGSIFISRVDEDRIFIRVSRFDEAVTGPVVVSVS